MRDFRRLNIPPEAQDDFSRAAGEVGHGPMEEGGSQYQMDQNQLGSTVDQMNRNLRADYEREQVQRQAIENVQRIAQEEQEEKTLRTLRIWAELRKPRYEGMDPELKKMLVEQALKMEDLGMKEDAGDGQIGLKDSSHDTSVAKPYVPETELDTTRAAGDNSWIRDGSINFADSIQKAHESTEKAMGFDGKSNRPEDDVLQGIKGFFDSVKKPAVPEGARAGYDPKSWPHNTFPQQKGPSLLDLMKGPAQPSTGGASGDFSGGDVDAERVMRGISNFLGGKGLDKVFE